MRILLESLSLAELECCLGMNTGVIDTENENDERVYSPLDWERMLANRFIPGQVSMCSGGPAGRIQTRPHTDYLSAAQLFVWPQTITHADHHIGSLPAHERSTVIAHAVIEGVGAIQQGSSYLPFKAGDISFRNLVQPSRVVFEAPSIFFAIRLPASMMRAHLTGTVGRRDMEPRVARSTVPFSDIAKQLLLQSQQSDRGGKAACASNVYMALALPWLFAAAYHDATTHDESAHSINELRWGQILNFLDIYVFDPDASSAAACARSIGISERYLHRLFALRGLRYSRLLLERRLVAARSMLSCTGYRKLTIGLIAYQCGFKDPAHFSRVFRTFFGLSPQQFRIASKVSGYLCEM